MLTKIRNFLQTHDTQLILLTSVVISIASFLYSYLHQQSNLADYDAIARLNIARRMIDSLTPGFGQLGGIWLPLPQFLMLPFIWHDFLWYSGLAGGIISMLALIFSALFIYKTTRLLANSRRAATVSWLIFVTNVNILYYQGTAMSEAFFLFTLCGSIYFLTKWQKTDDILDLMGAGGFVFLATLTRYEGYFLFIAAVVYVSIQAFARYRLKNYHKIEGTIILFSTLAAFGIALWMIYSALIFNDPIYFLNLYSGKKEVISQLETSSNLPSEFLTNVHDVRSFPKALQTYGWAVSLMNGILTTLLGILVLVPMALYGLWRIVRGQSPPVVYPTAMIFCIVFGFMIFGYLRGLIPGIETPPLQFQTILDKAFNTFSHTNIRYGLIPLPFFAIAAGAFYAQSIFTALLVFVLTSAQLITTFKTNYFLIFQIPKVFIYSISPYAQWFNRNYDGGLILVSANRHEPFMFQTKLPYRTFIYEGTRQIWFDSLKDPGKYATWVVYNTRLSGDAIMEQLEDFKILDRDFTLMYDQSNVKIYKNKNTPQEIPQDSGPQ